MQKHHQWPALNYFEWKNTYETLHRWLQIVGKLRLCKFPCTNHSWHSTFFVTARGLSTHAIPDGERNFSVEFDFVNHRLIFLTSDAKECSIELKNESVSSFYDRFIGCLKKCEIEASFDLHPNELMDNTPFDKDKRHCTYVPEKAHRCWQVLVKVSNVLSEYRSNFMGKSSPVHFFWGSFDLAVTRFSGRSAPEHPGGIPHIPDLVVKEAYSQEVSSCGFWPGNETFPQAAFYSYAYPEPLNFKKSIIAPLEAYYHEELHEFILPYEDVIKSAEPAKMIRAFFESTYYAASELGHWDKSSLEENAYLHQLKNFQKTNLVSF